MRGWICDETGGEIANSEGLEGLERAIGSKGNEDCSPAITTPGVMIIRTRNDKGLVLLRIIQVINRRALVRRLLLT